MWNQVRRGYLSDRIIFRRAGHHALTTFYTKFLVNPLFPIAGGKYSLHRTAGGTGITATCAQVQIKIKGDHGTAHQGRTTFFINMGFVFIPEIFNRSEYRIWGGFTQPAKGPGFYVLTQCHQQFNVAVLALALC